MCVCAFFSTHCHVHTDVRRQLPGSSPAASTVGPGHWTQIVSPDSLLPSEQSHWPNNSLFILVISYLLLSLVISLSLFSVSMTWIYVPFL